MLTTHANTYRTTVWKKLARLAMISATLLVATEASAYTLKVIPQPIPTSVGCDSFVAKCQLTVGFNPGSPVNSNPAGETVSASISKNDFVQLNAFDPRYSTAASPAITGIGGISVDQKANKLTIRDQPSSWSQFKLEVTRNGDPVGSMITDNGSDSIDITDLSSDDVIAITVSYNTDAVNETDKAHKP